MADGKRETVNGHVAKLFYLDEFEDYPAQFDLKCSPFCLFNDCQAENRKKPPRFSGAQGKQGPQSRVTFVLVASAVPRT